MELCLSEIHSQAWNNASTVGIGRNMEEGEAGVVHFLELVRIEDI